MNRTTADCAVALQTVFATRSGATALLAVHSSVAGAAKVQDDGRRARARSTAAGRALVRWGSGWPLSNSSIAISPYPWPAMRGCSNAGSACGPWLPTSAVIAGIPRSWSTAHRSTRYTRALAAFSHTGDHDTRPRRSSLRAVIAIVAMPWLSVKYTPVAAVLATGLLVSLRRSRRGSLTFGAAAAFIASAVVFAVVHVALYGGLTPYAAGTHFGDELSVMGDDPARLGRFQRVTGLLVDRDFGLAAWQPLFLLTMPAIAVWSVRARGSARWLLTCAVGGEAGRPRCFAALTMHGWWWPGRQTIVVHPAVRGRDRPARHVLERQGAACRARGRVVRAVELRLARGRRLRGTSHAHRRLRPICRSDRQSVAAHAARSARRHAGARRAACRLGRGDRRFGRRRRTEGSGSGAVGGADRVRRSRAEPRPDRAAAT